MILRILFFSLLCSSLCAQEQTIHAQIAEMNKITDYKKKKERNINSWYEHIEEYGFESINREKYDFVFRYWEDSSLIELTNKNSILKGFVYNFVTGVKYNQEEKVYLQLDTLNQIDAELIYNHIKVSNIKNIPSSEDILNWKQNYHYAPNYKIEIYDEGEYIFNDFIALYDQNEFTEPETVREFVNHLKTLANFKITLNDFKNRNPYDCYYYQDGIKICKIFSKKELRKRMKNEKL